MAKTTYQLKPSVVQDNLTATINGVSYTEEQLNQMALDKTKKKSIYDTRFDRNSLQSLIPKDNGLKTINGLMDSNNIIPDNNEVNLRSAQKTANALNVDLNPQDNPIGSNLKKASIDSTSSKSIFGNVFGSQNLALAGNLFNIGSSLVGANSSLKSIDKMKPELGGYQEPVPLVAPTYIKDNSAAIRASQNNQIEKNIATAVESDRKMGITGRNPLYAAKGIEGSNNVESAIAQNTMQRENINTSREYDANKTNTGNIINRNQFNARESDVKAQMQNQFDQWKSGLKSSVMTSRDATISGATDAIIQNKQYGEYMNFKKDTEQYQNLKDEYDSLDGILNSDRKKAISKQMESLNTRINQFKF